MRNNWSLVRRVRLYRAKNRCEYCGVEFLPHEKVVGHHLLGRNFTRQYHMEDSEYCRVRHAKCEEKAHKLYPNGNLPEEQELFNLIRVEFES